MLYTINYFSIFHGITYLHNFKYFIKNNTFLYNIDKLESNSDKNKKNLKSKLRKGYIFL